MKGNPSRIGVTNTEMTAYKTKIKRELIESIKEFPKTTNSLSKDLGITWKTAMNRCEELQSDGVIIKKDGKWRIND